MDDLQLRPEVPAARLERRGRLRDQVAQTMPELERAVARYDLPTYYHQALNLVLSGRARAAFDLNQESAALRERYGRNTFGQCLLLARRLIEAGTRVVQVNWPAVANGNPTVDAWDTHAQNAAKLRSLTAMTDQPSAALVMDLKRRGLLDSTIVLWTGEFGRLPISQGTDGRDHNRHAFSLWLAGGGFKRGYVHGQTDDFRV